jgi:hypothetical protein
MSLSGHLGKREHREISASPSNVNPAGTWSPMLGGTQAWDGAFRHAAAAIGREWLDFLSRRMREDMVLPLRLASCRGLDEAWRVSAEFWQKAVQDYQEEFAELVRLNFETLSENATSQQLGDGGAERSARSTRK